MDGLHLSPFAENHQQGSYRQWDDCGCGWVGQGQGGTLASLCIQTIATKKKGASFVTISLFRHPLDIDGQVGASLSSLEQVRANMSNSCIISIVPHTELHCSCIVPKK